MLESYITPMLMGYISKYVKNIKPSDLQVSFWGGDVVLRNLELRLDVLEQELRYPLQIRSGRIRELVLHIPWNAILSKPVEIVINDVEIVVKLKPIRLNAPATRNPAQEDVTQSDAPTTSAASEDMEKESSEQTQQGYLQGYTNRILNNLTFHVQNLVVKVIEEECDMMMSFNVQSLTFRMTDENWLPSYICTDYCTGDFSLNKLLDVSDMVIHLQSIDSERAHATTLKEPFVRKCSFTCRMQSQFQGKTFVKKSTCILFDSPIFYADENQFSLFFHLTDWLLAMYYNGKKLKGRDDDPAKNKSSQPAKQIGTGSVTSTDGPLQQEEVLSSFEDVLLAGSVEDMEGGTQELERAGGGGWGSWMWSFVAAEETDGPEKEGEEKPDSQPLAESSTLTIMANTITVNLKVTHHGRVPVFSSPRSRSRMVLSVLFSGCSIRVDNVPFTQLFTVSIGIMVIQSWASGFCSCSDAIPTSWKPSSEPNEKVLVFSLGDATSCDSDLVCTGSLFDPETQTTPPEKLPLPLPELLLAPRPEFSALWFTYEYYDIGPTHSCEVCEARVAVGEVDVLISPDTLHRVTHFTSAYVESVKACPLFSEGMVIIGDPRAETTFKITLAGGRAVVASNSHYLASFSSSSKDHPKSKQQSKTQSLAQSSSLPMLTATLGRSTISITSAMYSGNAALESPQRNQMRVSLSQLVIGEGGQFCLASQPTQPKRIFTVPELEVYSHSKTMGDGEVMQENDSSYLQLHIEEVSCVASVEQVSNVSFVVLSWYQPFIPGSLMAKGVSAHPKIPGGHLHISIREVELTKSVSASFTFLSATLNSLSVVLLCDSTRGRLCHAVPVVCGPIATSQWNTTEAYTSSTKSQKYDENVGSTERLLELFTAMPHKHNSDEMFSTLQLSLGGLAVCADSTVMEFLGCILTLVTREQVRYDLVQEPSQQQPMRDSGPQPSLHSEDTATEVTPCVPAEAPSEEESIIAKFKFCATKVEIQPMLIVVPSRPLEEGLMSPELPLFPVLPALRDCGSMEALLVALPQLSLISAKSHVLEEPVPRASSTNTLPWNCTLCDGSIIALHGASTARYIIEPLSVTISVADQQGGTGVTIHTDLVALSLSKIEADLLSVCVSEVVENLSLFFAPPLPEASEDSGVHSSEDPPPTPHHHPSHLSSPAPSTITTATVTTLPAHTSLGTASTTSSVFASHDFSTLWIQAIVSKFTLTILAPLPQNEGTSPAQTERNSVSAQSRTSSTGSFLTPLTSPTGEMAVLVPSSLPTETSVSIEDKSGRDAKSSTERESKFSLEVDGVSVQFDVQEKSTDLVVKVSGVGANLHRQNFMATTGEGGGKDSQPWVPYLSSEKLFSSRGSTLPHDLSEILTHSSSAAIHLPQGHTISSDSFRNFIALEVNIPRHSLHRATGVRLKVQSFEAVAWLPVIGMVTSVLVSLRFKGGKRAEQIEAATKQEPTDITFWPAVEATIECCRLVLPSSDYSNTLLCNIGCLSVSPSLEYPTTDVRYIVSASAFRRVMQLSGEKQQPPLPAYQLDLLAMSVWGIQREGGECAQLLLYAGSSDVRMVFTPALYWRPTVVGTSHKPAILACGHCIEFNFRTDLDLILGPQQVQCVSTILQTNTLSFATPATTPTHQMTSSNTLATPITLPTPQKTSSNVLATPTATPTHPSATSRRDKNSRSSGIVPFKGLVSGIAVRLTLVSPHSSNREEVAENSIDSASESSEFVFPTLHGLDSVVVPLSQMQLFNLLCGMTVSTGRVWQVEGSCFNMAVGYCGGDHLSCSYSDLVDAGVAQTLMDSPLLETRRGRSQNTREIPPSVVAVEINIHQHRPPVISVDICRPIKLTLTPQVITKLSDFGDSILQSVSTQHGMEARDTPTPADCVSESSKAAAQDVAISKKAEKDTKIHSPTTTAKSLTGGLQFKLKVIQFLMEYQLSTRHMDLTSGSGDGELCVSGEGEEMGVWPTGDVSVGEEGFLLVWDHLDLAYPNVTGSSARQTGDLHIDGLQLLSVLNCSTSPVVLPTQLNCFLAQHIPLSPLDLGYPSVNLSCGLLDVRLNQEVLDLASRVLDSITGLISSQGESLNDESEKGKKLENNLVHFHDDLRAGDFVYVKDSDVVVGYSPRPGEVFFSLGGQDRSTSMMWHYHEPRAVTKLTILPVPFSFTSESDAPIDIEVGCSLDYWDEEREIFSVIQEFHLTETTPTEVEVPRVVGARKWRISVVEVEWEDEEEGERFVGSSSDMVDGEGSPVPIAAILSPVLLAGGTCVDSYFSPDLVPVLDLSLTCHGMQTTLLYNSPPHSGCYDGYEAVQLTTAPQELLKFHVQNLTCHLKQTRNAEVAFQVDGELSIEFIDFLDLTWRKALHPTHLHLQLDRESLSQKASSESTRTSSDANTLCTVGLKCSPAVVRLSQGLIHTASLSLHTWTTERGREGNEVAPTRPPVILNHFILCNNTLLDIHFGQVATDEVLALCSRQCIGYSWRNTKISPQTLHLCIVTAGEWRWTKPFSMAAEGSRAVTAYIGRHIAVVNVCITNIGGLQRKVVFTGNWTFLSALPFPLQLSLISPLNQDTEMTHPNKAESFEPHDTFQLPPKSSLPSLVVPETQLCGVRVRCPQSDTWSEVFPIHSTADDWSKPQLLTEMEYSSEQRVNIWYNIKPIESSKQGTFGSKITFSPLFAICNHLPFDLTMVATETNAFGPAPTSLPECVLSGEGERTILCGLRASTWYYLSFKQSGCEGVSEPTVSLSTFLLVHLPFSAATTGLRDRERKWPYEDEEDIGFSDLSGKLGTSTIDVRLPLADASCCCLHAVLERDPINTITLHLVPDILLINRSSIPLGIVTRLVETVEEFSDESDGVREIVSTIHPDDISILPQNLFQIFAKWEDTTLLSQPLIAHPDKDKEQSQPKNVILTEIESNKKAFGIFGNLTLVRKFRGPMVFLTVIPTYIFHNNTSYELHVSASLFRPNNSRLEADSHSPLLVECVESGATRPMPFCEHGEMEGTGETVQALVVRTACEPNKWSLPLSSGFARHSFALPTSNEQYLPAVLTMHEHSDSFYMVVSLDPAPRLLIQNHTQQSFEVVQYGAKGIHSFPQHLPPAQEVVYEPPTYAKQYPLVFDAELAQSEGASATNEKMTKVAVKFRLCKTQRDTEEKEEEEESGTPQWSDAFNILSDSDRLLSVPGGEGLLVSTHRKGVTLHLALLPTGQAASLCTISVSASSSESSIVKKDAEMNINVRLEEVVVCVNDETTKDSETIEEVLQVIIDGVLLHFINSGREGASLELAVDSFHVNNLMESEGGDFAATVIPRAHHARRASLIDSEPTPLATLSVQYNPHSSNLIDSLCVSLQPLTLQLEDDLLNRLKCILVMYSTPGVLLLSPPLNKDAGSHILMPQSVLDEAERDVVPLAVKKLVIEPASFYLNARISLRVLLSCNDSPFHFSRYELHDIYSNWTEVSQTVASRYIMSTIAHVGWLVGSLELIGSPGTFIQNVGRGLRDLVALPYQGLTRSPTWFLLGIGQGTMSFVRHFSSGALGSVTSMASSLSHNMERLSLDPEHVSYQTQQRQRRPTTHLSMGLVSGASSFGLSLMSAVAGIVEQPMQSYHQMEGPTSPSVAARSILKGVGKGLIGAVTKPVGGVMELVSQTGQGLMHGTGLARRLPRKRVKLECFTGSVHRSGLQCSSTACAIKISGDLPLYLTTPVRYTSPSGSTNLALLLLSHSRLYLLDSTTNTLQLTFSLSDYILKQRDSGAGKLDEVEIEIMAKCPQSTELPSFHKVEYFLQQSCEKKAGEEASGGIPSFSELAASPTLDWGNPGFGDEIAPERGGVKLSIPTHHAAQLLSFFNSLPHLPLNWHVEFSIHRTLKSESFLTATSK